MIEEQLLQGMVCPHCESRGPFRILASFIINNTASFAFKNSSIVWGKNSEIFCSCGQIGRVVDFLADYHQVIPKQQQIKSLEARILELQDSLTSMLGHFAFPDFNDRIHSTDMPVLQQAFKVLGLTDPCKRSELVQCFSDHQKQDELNDIADDLLK